MQSAKTLIRQRGYVSLHFCDCLCFTVMFYSYEIDNPTWTEHTFVIWSYSRMGYSLWGFFRNLSCSLFYCCLQRILSNTVISLFGKRELVALVFVLVCALCTVCLGLFAIPGPEVIKLFSCSFQVSMEFVLLINLK